MGRYTDWSIAQSHSRFGWKKIKQKSPTFYVYLQARLEEWVNEAVDPIAIESSMNERIRTHIGTSN